MSLILNASAEQSDLWGKHGEKWNNHGRLPDFSFAGYHMGESPLPDEAAGTNVLDFGAVGDGKTDSTEAFRQAIAQAEGVIKIPEGRYLISDILWIKKSGIVLRGAGPDKTFIVPTTKLEQVRPNMGATTEGQQTSNYSWSGGFIWIKGQRNDKRLTGIITTAVRGDTTFEVADTSSLSVGQTVRVNIQDAHDASITRHLYAGDPGEGIADLYNLNKATFISRITDIQGNLLRIERPLRFDLRPAWKPTLTTFEPTVSECGIEQLSIEFPVEPYGGHFKELGMNAIAIEQAANCWVRNVDILHADSGIFLRSQFCTLENITFVSKRPDVTGDQGHHGISFTMDAQDNLLQHFEFRTQFIHDITVENMASGNVIKYGKGPNLSLDHHRWCPHDNLFCQIDCGEGKLIWRFGGGKQRGKHTARGATFWAIYSQQNIPHPGSEFGPAEVNFIGLHTAEPEVKDPNGLWWETIDPTELDPADLHAAQLQRRLEKR
ncbi:glycosyl hydrolase family 28-related protein [Coraliomargarita parva]|uniref:glycosyl hydrolase family 28-related protein n=1 Tax=Coraliomargarita parva TaxID=3014050 RepID=UPI0022B36374|nr:glycosyl hydrolase family 28-related protein [Coraliomargarita parva]